jgi:hypothetical protein
MIEAFQAGVPGNGQPFPDGAKMAKVDWNPKTMETFPSAMVPGTQHDVAPPWSAAAARSAFRCFQARHLS